LCLQTWRKPLSTLVEHKPMGLCKMDFSGALKTVETMKHCTGKTRTCPTKPQPYLLALKAKKRRTLQNSHQHGRYWNVKLLNNSKPPFKVYPCMSCETFRSSDRGPAGLVPTLQAFRAVKVPSSCGSGDNPIFYGLYTHKNGDFGDGLLSGWWHTMVYLDPSEKWWSESQLGWWHSQDDGKVIKLLKFMF